MQGVFLSLEAQEWEYRHLDFQEIASNLPEAYSFLDSIWRHTSFLGTQPPCVAEGTGNGKVSTMVNNFKPMQSLQA